MSKSAPQASQIADQQNAALMRSIIVQNQKIIELWKSRRRKSKELIYLSKCQNEQRTAFHHTRK